MVGGNITEWPDEALDNRGFLLDNMMFRGYFTGLGYTTDSCELLVLAAKHFKGLATTAKKVNRLGRSSRAGDDHEHSTVIALNLVGNCYHQSSDGLRRPFLFKVIRVERLNSLHRKNRIFSAVGTSNVVYTRRF